MKTTSIKNSLLNIPLVLSLFTILTFGLFSFANKITGFGEEAPTGEIKGLVTDKASGKSIDFVKIILKDINGNKVAETMTDHMGYYDFASVNAGEYSLAASLMGYKAETIYKVMVVSNTKTEVNILMNIEAEKKDKIANAENKKENIAVEMDASEDYIAAPAKMKMGSAAGCMSYEMSASPGNYYNTDFNTEQYNYISENEFKNVKDEALSTFSIDVDRASYSNVRRFINNGQTPPQDAVRIEEMINYFSYDYPQPKGDDPFSITTEMSDCPWNSKHRLVHIGLQGKKIQIENLPANNLVFLIDVSGSMSDYNKLPLVKQSLRLLVNQLRGQDRVALVVYAGAAGLVLESTPGSYKEKILEAIENLSSGGSTAGGAGIKLAYNVAKENFIKNGNNRVILASDGDFNVGASSDGELARLIEEKREMGIYLTVLGYGMGNYKDSKMEQLADKGNGNYAYIDNIMEAKKTLVTEMGGTLLTIAKDVKIQIEFNPAKVASYKLIGYENRLLNKEDFNDDNKDAGEMGAGHTVTALYEIVLVGGDENSTGKVDPLRYQTPNTVNQSAISSEELLTVKFRYKKPNETESKLIVQYLKDVNKDLESSSNNFKFSAAVAEFGLLLRDSKFKGNSNYEEVLKLAKMGKGIDEEGYRSEFIRLVELHQLQAKK